MTTLLALPLSAAPTALGLNYLPGICTSLHRPASGKSANESDGSHRQRGFSGKETLVLSTGKSTRKLCKKCFQGCFKGGERVGKIGVGVGGGCAGACCPVSGMANIRADMAISTRMTHSGHRELILL
jgi:hypothetical protein